MLRPFAHLVLAVSLTIGGARCGDDAKRELANPTDEASSQTNSSADDTSTDGAGALADGDGGVAAPGDSTDEALSESGTEGSDTSGGSSESDGADTDGDGDLSDADSGSVGTSDAMPAAGADAGVGPDDADASLDDVGDDVNGDSGSNAAQLTEPVPLIPDDNGAILDNEAGARGQWFAENDCESSLDECTVDHVIGPTSNQAPYDSDAFPILDGSACTRGTTAHVMSDAEYSTKWGARIVVPLNQALDSELNAFDATARGIGGISVNVESVMSANVALRIAFRTEGVPDPYIIERRGLSSYESFTIHFAGLTQASWANPIVAFDASKLTAIEFMIPSQIGYEHAFDFCVSDLTLLPVAMLEEDLSEEVPELPDGTHAVPLEMDATGRILPNDANISGSWFSDDDCALSPDDCTLSHVPEPGTDFAPSADVDGSGLAMCTSGVAVPVYAEAEYETKWGAAIGFHLNQAPDADPSPYDASANGVVGFAFVLRSRVPAPIRFEAVSEDLAEPHVRETFDSGAYAQQFVYLRQGDWVEDPVDIDPTLLLSFRFHVPTGPSLIRTFNFCVENLAAIVED